MKTTLKILLLFVFFNTGTLTKIYPVTHIVNVEDYEFNPQTVNVNVGDSVIWSWDRGIHTTTSMNIPSGAAFWAAPIDAGNLTFTYVVTVPGTYDYQCDYHVSMGMTGRIIASGSTSIENVSTSFRYSYSLVGSELLKINYENLPKNMSIGIMNLTGSMVKQFIPERKQSSFSESYFIGDLPKGIYIIRVYNREHMYAERIVIQ